MDEKQKSISVTRIILSSILRLYTANIASNVDTAGAVARRNAPLLSFFPPPPPPPPPFTRFRTVPPPAARPADDDDCDRVLFMPTR